MAIAKASNQRLVPILSDTLTARKMLGDSIETMVTLIDTFEPLIGLPLTAARFLIFDPPDESGVPMREAVELRFGQQTILIRALTDTSEMAVSSGTLVVPDESGYHIVDAIAHDRIATFADKMLRNWWSLTNDHGYSDGFMIAFSAHDVLLFVAMNNDVSLLTLNGEQCS